MVGLRCEDGSISHAIVLVMKQSITTGLLPSSVVYLYQSFRKSQGLLSNHVNSHIDMINPGELYLGTAHQPVFMDDQNVFGHIQMGFKHLSALEALSANCLIKPMQDCEQRTSLMDVNDLDNALDLFILYIWTGVSLKVNDQYIYSNII